MMNRVRVENVGGFSYMDENGSHSANFPLYLIRLAWNDDVDFEDLADGYGEGMGTMGGDWSGIRDSSHAAIEAMLERALNFFFGG